jgi:hypothetical protein
VSLTWGCRSGIFQDCGATEQVSWKVRRSETSRVVTATRVLVGDQWSGQVELGIWSSGSWSL